VAAASRAVRSRARRPRPTSRPEWRSPCGFHGYQHCSRFGERHVPPVSQSMGWSEDSDDGLSGEASLRTSMTDAIVRRYPMTCNARRELPFLPPSESRARSRECCSLGCGSHPRARMQPRRAPSRHRRAGVAELQPKSQIDAARAASSRGIEQAADVREPFRPDRSCARVGVLSRAGRRPAGGTSLSEASTLTNRGFSDYRAGPPELAPVEGTCPFAQVCPNTAVAAAQ
jgi:hypothetical protein